MERKYTKQDIALFYSKSKNIPDFYDLEKVHQLLNNPDAKATHKVNSHFKHLKLIIMTSAFIIIFTNLFLGIKPLTKKTEQVSTNIEIDNKQSTLTDNHSQVNFENQKIGNNKQNLTIKSNKKTKEKKSTISTPPITNTSDNTINGNKFILDLTFDELRNLGFQITHYSVFYRNSHVIYSSIHEKLKFGYQYDSISETQRPNWLNNNLVLQTDTFPDNAKFFYFKHTVIMYPAPGQNRFKREFVLLNKQDDDFYPVFISELDGTIMDLFNTNNFEIQNDTLVPIVLRFSRLRTGRKKDLIFWFTPTDELFQILPNRYSWLKTEFDNTKKHKTKYPNENLVSYDINQWVNDQLFKEESINGENYKISLTDLELEKLGCFRDRPGSDPHYNFKTLDSGGGVGGGKQIEINGVKINVPDTTLYTDYMPVFNTFSNGNSRSFSTTTKELDQFLIDNDVSLPVLIKNPQWKDIILWFSLSENFWKLIPERYQYLKEIYDKILFNKSIYPKKDLVRYFPKPFNRIDIDVNILQLNKEEIENIGFKFNQEKFSIDCAIDSSWIKYEAYEDTEYLNSLSERYAKMTEKQRSRIEKFHLHENITFRSPNGRMGLVTHLQKSDSLRKNAEQGFLFLGITDTLGRVLNMIYLDWFLGTVHSFNSDLLIPVMVNQSKYLNEKFEDKVFWFTPTKEFIERLPDRYRKDLNDELEQLKSNSTSSCTYFEICKSTLQLNNFNMYPNPAKKSVTIEFDIKEQLEGSIEIVNIAGASIKTLVSNRTFSSGHNEYDMDLSGLTSGIYLVSVITDKGFKTQRLIISQ